jgi:hypothetical protein
MTTYRGSKHWECRQMMYRDPEETQRARIAALEVQDKALGEAQAALEAKIDQARRELRTARARLEEAGPGGGSRGARRDRIDIAAWVLVAVAVCLGYFHVDWNRSVAREPSVIAAILWLGSPALLALLVAWPYRAFSRRCRWAVVAAGVLCLVPLANVIVGLQ